MMGSRLLFFPPLLRAEPLPLFRLPPPLDLRGALEDGLPDERANATSVAVPRAIRRRAILMVTLLLLTDGTQDNPPGHGQCEW
mmetsp:Transcript_4919/g.10836  ORF Transcript_4919/g.10836 Transcript_4919/m.10836 type:complete len:83 (-) Transcript_4919:34-282(-)